MRPSNHAAIVLCLTASLVLILAAPASGQQSLQFSDAGDYAVIPHDTSLTPAEITIETWIRVHAVGDPSEAGGEQSVLDKRGAGSGYQFRLAGTAFPLGAGVVAEPNMIFYPDLVQAYRWHHMAMTQDADSLTFYFDGTLVERMSNTYAPASASELFLGELTGCPQGCLWLRGEIDDLRIWDHARTQTQIVDNMHVKPTGGEAGLVAYWDFDSDTGTAVSDVTANGNDGTLFGNAAFIPSDAPVGFTPLPAPNGLRTHGGESGVDVLWRPLDSLDVDAYNIYRADERLVPITPANLLATVSVPDSTHTDLTAVLDQTYFYAIAAVDAGGHVGLRSQETPGKRTHIFKDYYVGTHYFLNRGDGADWWSGRYLRDYLVPQQPPALGHYDSRDPAVIDQHLDWMLEYGIDFFVGEWWGQTSHEDSVLRENVLPELSGRPTKFTVYYQTATLPDAGNIDATQEDMLVSDFTYIANTYFSHPNFLRYEDRPVVFIYRSRNFGGNYEQAFARIRSELLQLGHDVYLVGDDIARNLTPDPAHFQFLDAITMFRALTRPPAGGYGLDSNAYGANARFLALWYLTAAAEGKGFIPPVSPGANLRPSNAAYWIVPRECREGAGPTSHLDEQTRVLRSYVDPQLKAVMVSSWNKWEDDTQVEPSVVTAATTQDVSGTDQYTGGYSYTGYGRKCLELLQSLLGYDPGRVILVSPFDDALGQPRRPLLTWSELEGASMYHLQVSKVANFSSFVFDQDLLTAAQMKPDTLDANTTFYWRVRGQSSGGSGAWSDPFRFTTGTLVPVRLAYLRAERDIEGSVTVSWKVLDAQNHAGFHVYRSSGWVEGSEGGVNTEPDERVRLSSRLLSGRTQYTFTDATAPPQAVDYWLQEIDRTGVERWIGPVRASAARPQSWTLYLTQNRPNPVRSTTMVRFTVPSTTEVTLQILDINGRLVSSPFEQVCGPGPHEVSWDGRDATGRPLPNGVYFYRLVTGKGVRSARLVLLK